MSSKIKTIEVPATTRQTQLVTCDICGAERGAIGWNSSGYERDEVDVQTTRFTSYPECGRERGERWDFCPSCFKDKVRPLLLTLAAPRVVESDW